MSEQLPSPDLARVAATKPDVTRLQAETRLARVHYLGGSHPTGWDEMRHFGPTTSRFDHHPLPQDHHPDHGIAYLTTGNRAITTACAEVFQRADGSGVGPIDRTRRRPALAIFALASDITLLDLTTGWIARAGGNAAICSGPRTVCREWARAIHQAHGDTIDGIVYPSSVWPPGRCVAVWADALRVFPVTPIIARDLNDNRLDLWLDAAADALNTYTFR